MLRLLYCFLLITLSLDARAFKEFVIIKNCELEKDKFTNDGDSFKVRLGGDKGKLMVVRLYGVDCMETNDREDYMKARLREQGFYFGVQGKDDNFKVTLKLGKGATSIVEKALQKPFTIKTKHVNAMGKQLRYYAYVITADGKDLGELLVNAGLARIYGRADDLPNALMPYEYRNKLEIKEILAIKARVGAWKWTNWREFENERAAYRKLISKLNINVMENNPANVDLIAFRSGVSKKIAQAVLKEKDKAVFKNMSNLDDRVKGVGGKTADKLAKVLVFE